MDSKLYSAIKNGFTAGFEEAVKKNKKATLQARTKRNDTVLHVACKNGSQAIVESILSMCPEMVNTANVYGETPMHVTCMHGHFRVLTMLTESDPSRVGDVDNHGRTPLYMACQYNRVRLVEHLLQYISLSDIQKDDGLCIQAATSAGHGDIVRALLRAHPTLALTTYENEDTLLHIAVSNECFQIAEYVINNTSLDVNARNANGKTAFDIVAAYGCHTLGSRTVHKLLLDKQLTIHGQEIEDQIDLEDGSNTLPEFVLVKEQMIHIQEIGNQLDLADVSHSLGRRISPETINDSKIEDQYLIDFLSSPKQPHTEKNEDEDKDEDEDKVEDEEGRLARENYDLEQHKLKSIKRRQDLIKLHRKQQQQKREHKRIYEDQYLIDFLSSPKQPHTEKNEDEDKDEDKVEDEEGRLARENYDLEQHKLKSIKRRQDLIRKLHRKQQQQQREHKRIYEEGLQNARNTVVIVAVLIATVAFTTGLNPPGGVYQGGPHIGESVLAKKMAFKVFMVSNTIALFASLGIVMVHVSVIPFKTKPLLRILKYSHRVMWVAVVFMAMAFVAASWATLPIDRHPHGKDGTRWMRVVLLVVAIGSLGAVFLGYSFLLGTHLKRKCKWRRERVPDRKEQWNESNQDEDENENRQNEDESEISLDENDGRVLKRRLGKYACEISSISDVASSSELGYHPI